MKNFFLMKILALIGRKTNGYKTKIGGVGLILSGLTGILGIIYPDQGLPQMDLDASIAMIGLGMTALGLGGKAEKQTAAIETQNDLVKQQNELLERDTSREGLRG